MKRFKVISIHATNICDLECSFCYKKKGEIEPNTKLFYGLPKYLRQLTDQVACLPENEMIFSTDNHNVEAKALSSVRDNDIIMGDQSFGKVKRVIKKETGEEIYLITATGNRRFRATENHLIPTDKGLKKVKDLQIGDGLFINLNIKVPEIKEINLSHELKRLKIKHRIFNGKIIIERHKYRLPEKLKVTKELSRLAGYYTSEGSSRSFVFNKKEINKINEVARDYKKLFGVEINRRIRKNALTLDVPSKFIQDFIFKEALGIKGNANEKGIGKIFYFPKDCLFEYCKGLFGGDGNIRSRIEGISIHYKTSSKKLVEELRFLLEARLGIICSVYEGVNKERKIEKRILKESKYYSLNIYNKQNMAPLVPYLIYLMGYEKFIGKYKKIGTGKHTNKKFLLRDIKIISIKKLEKIKNVIDIQMDKPHLFTVNGNIIIHNCGGGEIMLFPSFVKRFGKECKKHKLIFNVTTNGKALMKMKNKELKEVLKDITMISISFDNSKIKTFKDFYDYARLVGRVKRDTKCQVGSNLLIDETLFERGGLKFLMVVNRLFQIGCDRVFALSRKNVPCPKILNYSHIYELLTIGHKHFYIDDLIKMILEQKSYGEWKEPCHYFKDLISINEVGEVTGCSFDNDSKHLLKIKSSKDIMKILKIKAEERRSCPYLNIKGVLKKEEARRL